MAERKTQQLTLPSGTLVEIKEYISAGEFLDATDTKDGTDVPKNQLARKLVEIAVVSVAGSKDNVPDALRNLPLADYLAISKEIAKLTNADFTEAKNL